MVRNRGEIVGWGGGCRGRSVVSGRWRGSGSGRFRVVVGSRCSVMGRGVGRDAVLVVVVWGWVVV